VMGNIGDGQEIQGAPHPDSSLIKTLIDELHRPINVGDPLLAL
jgi:hypothetical protein